MIQPSSSPREPPSSQVAAMAAGSRFFTKSPSAANILPSSSFSGQISSGDQVRASVAHLLAHADTLPCSTAAQAFFQLVQPTARFQLALDALLPLLNPSVEVCPSPECCLPLDVLSRLLHHSSLSVFWSLLFCILCILLTPFHSTPSNLHCMLPLFPSGSKPSRSLPGVVSARTSNWSGFCGRS